LLAGCGSIPKQKLFLKKVGLFKPDANPAELRIRVNEFAADLWHRFRLKEGNFAVSPASVSLALAMTWAGARGETADQMAEVLHFEGREGIHEAATALLYRWNNPDRTTYDLRVVNRLFGEQIYSFKKQYLELVRRRYGAPLECVDFRNAPERSRTKINAWIKTQTAERIRSLVDPGELDLVLFTSSSTVRHLADILGDDAVERLNALDLFSIGPVTSRTAKRRPPRHRAAEPEGPHHAQRYSADPRHRS